MLGQRRNPANTKHLHNICTTPAQRLRRWSNIVQRLYKYVVSTGNVTIKQILRQRVFSALSQTDEEENSEKLTR